MFDINFDIDYQIDRYDLYLLFKTLTLNIINYYTFIKYNIVHLLYFIHSLYNQFVITIQKNEGLRVCFISIFVATILTIYETLLFYGFVIPEINKEVNEGIRLMAYQVKQQLNLNFINVDTILDNNNDMFSGLLNYLNITIPYYDKDTNSMIYLNQYNINYNEMYSSYITTLNTFIITNINNILQYLLKSDITKIFILSILKTLYLRELEYVNRINNYTIITVTLLLGFLVFSLLLIYNTLNERKELLGNYVWVSSIFTICMILLFQYSFFIYANKYKYMGSTNTDEIIYYVLYQL
jgi:hypothetical protein